MFLWIRPRELKRSRIGWAVAKALLAFAIVFVAGRWLLRPLFHAVAVLGVAGAALHEFASVFDGLPDSRDKAFIRGLVTWVIERT